jgi:hypothetical protein
MSDSEYELVLEVPTDDGPGPADRNPDWDALFAAMDRLGLAGTEAWAELVVTRLAECKRNTSYRADGSLEWI